MKEYFVYIITNKNDSVLYTGMTNDLERRMYEHKNKLVPGFSSKYNLNKLLYYEQFNDPKQAIVAEKKIKGWRREKKLQLISEFNPGWKDLSEDPSFYSG